LIDWVCQDPELRDNNIGWSALDIAAGLDKRSFVSWMLPKRKQPANVGS